MTHKDAPPETPSQIECREWWQKREPHVMRAWGRGSDGNYLAESTRSLHAAWEAAKREATTPLRVDVRQWIEDVTEQLRIMSWNFAAMPQLSNDTIARIEKLRDSAPKVHVEAGNGEPGTATAPVGVTTVRFLDGGVVQMDRADYNKLTVARQPSVAPVGVEAMHGIRRELVGIVRRDDGEPLWIEPNEAAAILRALAQQPAAVDGVAWVRAVDDEMVAAHIGVADAHDDYDTARRKLNELISWRIDVATNPETNGGQVLRPAAVDEKAQLDTERMDEITRRRLAVTPMEGGGWDVYAFGADCKETLLGSGADVRSAIDEAIDSAGQQQEKGS